MSTNVMSSIILWILLLLLRFITVTVATVPTTPCNGTRTINVAGPTEFAQSLTTSLPGDLIQLADGVYSGTFSVTVSGTKDLPITICGTSNAILTGPAVHSNYGLHLCSVNYIHLVGFSITNSQKGIVLDAASYNIIDGVTVYHIGMEAIHFRMSSTHNRLQNSHVYDTGVDTAAYGECVYVGSAKSNMVNDQSNYNAIVGNLIENCRAECIDIKEYSCCGIVDGNTFGGDFIADANSADSWVDVKGNYYSIINNVGQHTAGVGSLVDGIQTHQVVVGWGNYNTFDNNTLNVNAPGYGINVNTQNVGNIVGCRNVATGAASGLSTVSCGGDPPRVPLAPSSSANPVAPNCHMTTVGYISHSTQRIPLPLPFIVCLFVVSSLLAAAA